MIHRKNTPLVMEKSNYQNIEYECSFCHIRPSGFNLHIPLADIEKIVKFSLVECSSLGQSIRQRLSAIPFFCTPHLVTSNNFV